MALFSASGGSGVTEINNPAAITTTPNQQITIPTSKKAKGFSLSYIYNNTQFFFSAFDGVNDNKMMRWDLGYTANVATFTNNSIILPSLGSVSLTVKAFIYY